VAAYPGVLNVLKGAAPVDPAVGLDYAGLLSSASPALMLAIFIVALSTRRLILPRELDNCEKRVRELEGERDEFKAMAFRALNVGERVVSVAEERGR
jgi:cell division protein FtsL